MSPLDIDTALAWRGRTVVDRDGEKIGTFEELYLDESDRPAWAAVKTGLFGLRQTFVPLSAAQPAGDDLQVPFDKQQVKDAPNVDPDAQLSAEEEDTLFRHYGLQPEGASGGEPPSQPAREPDAVATDGEQAREPEQEPAAAPEAAPADDDQRPEPARSDEGAEMVRSEEEVSVGTRRRVSGRARLKKHVVTEYVQKTVPVQRERVSVELEPAADGNVPASDRHTGTEPDRDPGRRPDSEQR
jgi:stress response protein YsnF